MRCFTVLALCLLSSCVSPKEMVEGPPKLSALLSVGSEARHNMDTTAGIRARWTSGLSMSLEGGRRHRVELPSTRGFPEETLIIYKLEAPLN